MFADLRWPGWVDLPFDVSMSAQFCKGKIGFLPNTFLPLQNWADIFFSINTQFCRGRGRFGKNC